MYMSGHGRPPAPPSVPEITFEDFMRAFPEILAAMNRASERFIKVCEYPLGVLQQTKGNQHGTAR